MVRYPRFYPEDPEPEPDEIVTPRHEWFTTEPCHACLKQAVATCLIERGDEVDPAKFRTCHDHAINVALAGGSVVLD